MPAFAALRLDGGRGFEVLRRGLRIRETMQAHLPQSIVQRRAVRVFIGAVDPLLEVRA